MKEIVKKIAEEYSLRPIVVEAILKSEFELVKDVMQEGNYETIHLPYFGKFGVNPNRRSYLLNFNKRKKEEELKCNCPTNL